MAFGKQLRLSLTLSLAIVALAAIAHVATFSRVSPNSLMPTAVAAVMVGIGFISPLWISPKLSNGAARQLFYVAWRLGILLPSVALAGYWTGDERNCFINVLLACYFVALPLESWLLIQEIRETDT